MTQDVSIVFGANGAIGSVLAEMESKFTHVVGTYRREDHITEYMKTLPNVTMYQKDFAENCDTSDVVELARSKGRVTKVYMMSGSSWNMGWDNANLMDFKKAIEVNAFPMATAIMALTPELSDESNCMRWLAITGTSSLVVGEGCNKPTTGGSKKLNEFYMKSAAAFWGCKNNLFNTIINGDSEPKEGRICGNTAEERERIIQKVIPLKRQAKPVETAEMCLWFNSEKNTFCTGGEIVCDGGRHIHTHHNFDDSPNRPHPKYY